MCKLHVPGGSLKQDALTASTLMLHGFTAGWPSGVSPGHWQDSKVMKPNAAARSIIPPRSTIASRGLISDAQAIGISKHIAFNHTHQFFTLATRQSSTRRKKKNMVPRGCIFLEMTKAPNVLFPSRAPGNHCSDSPALMAPLHQQSSPRFPHGVTKPTGYRLGDSGPVSHCSPPTKNAKSLPRPLASGPKANGFPGHGHLQ